MLTRDPLKSRCILIFIPDEYIWSCATLDVTIFLPLDSNFLTYISLLPRKSFDAVFADVTGEHRRGGRHFPRRPLLPLGAFGPGGAGFPPLGQGAWDAGFPFQSYGAGFSGRTDFAGSAGFARFPVFSL